MPVKARIKKRIYPKRVENAPGGKIVRKNGVFIFIPNQKIYSMVWPYPND